MSAPNVLGISAGPTRAAYRQRVAQIIRCVKLTNGLTNVGLGDRIDCSDETVSNAENERTSLDPVLLLKIEHEFGEGTIDLVLDLARQHDLGTDEHEDLLPLLAALLMAVATARSPSSPGGIAETHGELLAMETMLLDARRGINRRLARIQRLRWC
ncbi:MAG TPA: hypothetical protein VFW19_10730 [Allosphingosinicella sp.]|nr:hypothetical protein [Allosphingosinicella sp.]